MSAFGLAPDTYFCASDGAYIFLDARADRYFAHTGEAARLFSEIIAADRAESLSHKAGRFADHLIRKGVLLLPPAAGRPLVACAAPRPDASRFADASLLAGTAGSSEWPRLLTALFRSWTLKRTQSLRFCRCCTYCRFEIWSSKKVNSRMVSGRKPARTHRRTKLTA